MKPTSERIQLLNQGLAETKNLMEALAVDFNVLIPQALPAFKGLEFTKHVGITQRMQYLAVAIQGTHSFTAFETLSQHAADSLRGLACYLLAIQPISLADKIALVKPLADDAHFGVREWAWLALRPEVVSNTDEALQLLEPWVHDTSERVRRFASEMTRPRGVWCAHLPQLRQQPWAAQHLLEPLKSDPAKYVQLSVGNWLNDAGKDHPTWVQALCKVWQQSSPTEATQKICKRGLRRF